MKRTGSAGRPSSEKISRQLIVKPGPVDPIRQDDEFVLHVDDLVETGAEQVVMPRLRLLFRSHVIPQHQCHQGITNGLENISQIARKQPLKPRFPANSIIPNQRKYPDCQRHSGSSQGTKYSLLVIDELGFVPLSKTGAELLFEVFSQRYERGATLVTSNLPFDEWTEIFGSERLTGALLDRLTHHVHILEMNGESYRLNQSQKRRKSPKPPA